MGIVDCWLVGSTLKVNKLMGEVNQLAVMLLQAHFGPLLDSLDG